MEREVLQAFLFVLLQRLDQAQLAFSYWDQHAAHTFVFQFFFEHCETQGFIQTAGLFYAADRNAEVVYLSHRSLLTLLAAAIVLPVGEPDGRGSFAFAPP